MSRRICKKNNHSDDEYVPSSSDYDQYSSGSDSDSDDSSSSESDVDNDEDLSDIEEEEVDSDEDDEESIRFSLSQDNLMELNEARCNSMLHRKYFVVFLCIVNYTKLFFYT